MTKAYCSSCGHGLANAHERPQATQGNLGQDITELVVGVSCSLPQLLKSGPPQSSPVLIMPACHDQPARCSNGVGQPSRADSAGWGCLVQLLSCTAQAEEDMLPAGMPGQAVEAISVQYKLAAAAVARETHSTGGDILMRCTAQAAQDLLPQACETRASCPKAVQACSCIRSEVTWAGWGGAH